MQLVSPEFGTAFYVLSLLVSGGLFFGFRRLYRRRLASEAAVLAATVFSAVLVTPIVLLVLAWLFHLVTRS